MKRKVKIFLLLFILFLIYVYVASISLLPKSMLLIEGESLDLATLWGIVVEEKGNTNPNIGKYEQGKILQTSGSYNKEEQEDMAKIDLSLKLFNTDIELKEVEVNVIPKTKVIPLGNAIGLKLYTEGVLVVGMTEIEGKRPYENTGIQEGDRIISINNETISSTDDLIETVNKSQGKEITIKYIREDVEESINITPVETKDNEYKLGLWVRDAAAGVGTLSFYVPSSKMFGCLGHGITDIDTSKLITISNGELVTTNIVSIQKGEKGKPGEIKGSIEGGRDLGQISKNTSFGVFGKIDNINAINFNEKEMEIANRNEIKKGKAQIICELEVGNKKYYDIEIEKIYTSNNKDNKSMLIKITDKELLEKTGGIIQGMSGSPIVQDGKFVGAVTHVLVNDPTTGYAVFADLMIKQMSEIN